MYISLMIPGTPTSTVIPYTTLFQSTNGYLETYTGASWFDYSVGAGGAGGDIKSDGSVAFAANESLGGFNLTNVATITATTGNIGTVNATGAGTRLAVTNNATVGGTL